MHSFHDSSRIAEDRELRSEYIRELVQEAAPIESSSNRTEIPKVIVQFWHDLDAIPGDVQECVDSWEPLIKRGFTRVLFDNDQARRFIAKTLGRVHVSAFNECHHPAMRCDYFRLCYIFMHGGFYIDADELYQGTECSGSFYDNRLKIQPLCYDTGSGAMISTDVFVRQRRRSPGWIYYVNNNPIIAPAYHPVIRSALDRSTRILLSRVKERADIQSTTGPGNRHWIAPRLCHVVQLGDDVDQSLAIELSKR